MTDNSGFVGSQRQTDTASEWNTLTFLVRRLLRRMSTATLVKVMGVTNNGGLSPVGFVDIMPLVNMLDGAGVAVPHGTIYHCPYLRLQGGSNAVIIDPEVDDIGIALFSDRDISSVIANKGQANPGSRRRFDMSDGMYLGGVLNGVPTQYVQMSGAGIKMHSPTAIVLDAPSIELDCQTFSLTASTSASITTPTLTINGNVHATGNTELDGTTTMVGAAAMLATMEVVGIASFDAAMIDVRTGKDMGGTHEHDHGTMTGSGHTGTVI